MSDPYYLCCNCGGIAAADDFEALKSDDEGENLSPIEPGDMDPVLKCPLCGWLHTDDDANPGIEDGTRLELTGRRREYLRDPIWADSWRLGG